MNRIEERDDTTKTEACNEDFLVEPMMSLHAYRVQTLATCCHHTCQGHGEGDQKFYIQPHSAKLNEKFKYSTRNSTNSTRNSTNSTRFGDKRAGRGDFMLQMVRKLSKYSACQPYCPTFLRCPQHPRSTCA
jgi:hypothetical protein